MQNRITCSPIHTTFNHLGKSHHLWITWKILLLVFTCYQITLRSTYLLNHALLYLFAKDRGVVIRIENRDGDRGWSSGDRDSVVRGHHCQNVTVTKLSVQRLFQEKKKLVTNLFLIFWSLNSMYFSTSWFIQLIAWLIDWLVGCWINWLTDWSIHWRDWLND